MERWCLISLNFFFKCHEISKEIFKIDIKLPLIIILRNKILKHLWFESVTPRGKTLLNFFSCNYVTKTKLFDIRITATFSIFKTGITFREKCILAYHENLRTIKETVPISWEYPNIIFVYKPRVYQRCPFFVLIFHVKYLRYSPIYLPTWLSKAWKVIYVYKRRHLPTYFLLICNQNQIYNVNPSQKSNKCFKSKRIYSLVRETQFRI